MEYEYPDKCESSIEQVRAELTQQLRFLDAESNLAKSFRAMRAACRSFLDNVQRESLIVKRLGEYPYEAKHWQFIDALATLRREIGFHVAALSVTYGVDIEPGLAQILPAKPDQGDA